MIQGGPWSGSSVRGCPTSEVIAVEETPDTIYLVLPSASPLVGEDGELSDQDLEAVAGGSDTWLQCGPVSANVMCTQGC